MSHPIWQPIEGVRVLGITGRARAGKDTLAREIIRRIPGAERFAFSDGVAAVERAVPWLADPMTTRDPRRLQARGELERQKDPYVWLRVTYGAIQDRRPVLAIITGLRTPAEVDLVRGMGGLVVRVRREGPQGHYVATDRDPDHPIERQIESLAATYEVIIQDGHADTMMPSAATWVLEAMQLVEAPAL